MLSYTYWGFGLHIASQIEFPELVPVKFAEADVEIHIASVPRVLGEKKISPAGFSYIQNDTELLLEINDVATYYAKNGNNIIIQPHESLTAMRELRVYVLATVLAAILTQRKQLPVHASAILHKNRLILICGDSGAGKSTTLAGLIKKGHLVFSDDVVVIGQDNQTTASYPMIKLWEDAQDKLEHALFDDRSFTIKPGMNKYGIFFHDKFDMGKYRVKKVLILKKDDVAFIESKHIAASAAFKELSKQVYRPMLIHNNELRALKFSVISALANNAAVYQITRPATCNVNDLVNYVENMIYNEA